MFKFFIERPELKPELEYILKIWGQSLNVPIEISDNSQNSISLTLDGDASEAKNWTIEGLSKLFNNDERLLEAQSPAASLQTAFYLINAVQEYLTNDPDELGRFRFRNSYQSRLNNTGENIVQKYFDRVAEQWNITSTKRKTRFFLTHDIDLVYSAIIEDGFNIIKKGRVDQFFGMLFRLAMGRPDWLNIDKIMKLETSYDCKSVFYWIVNKGVINKRERNADYSFASRSIQKQFRDVTAAGFENGIHKSISQESFADEFMKYGKVPLGNRFHYLKFAIPRAFDAIEKSGLKLDASLGFAEKSGFRNSYGLPFNPFNFEERRPFDFVEVPLHIMDRTFFQYQRISPDLAHQQIIDFFEKNKENCVLSVLWHNNFFTDFKFKGYLKLYKKILAYIKDSDFKTISQEEIVEQYSIVK